MKISSIRSILILVTFPILIYACDPAQNIVIVNNSQEKASIEFVFSQPDGYYDFDYDSSSDTLLIELDTMDTLLSKEFHFGIGTWKINHAIDSLTAMLESIRITSWKSTEYYKGDKQIKNFLESRLTGKYDQTIEILIE